MKIGNVTKKSFKKGSERKKRYHKTNDQEKIGAISLAIVIKINS